MNEGAKKSWRQAMCAVSKTFDFDHTYFYLSITHPDTIGLPSTSDETRVLSTFPIFLMGLEPKGIAK